MMRLLLRLLVLMTLLPLTATGQPQTDQTKTARIAVIIDDIGNNHSDLKAAVLPGQLTFSLLPFTPYAHSFALQAHHQNKQIMLHAPMQAVKGNRLGPGALTADMSNADIKLTLRKALDSLPYVQGVNNHMGSYLTQVKPAMTAVMETLQRRGLYFIDSRTSEFSVGEKTAAEYLVPTAHRHVFLDNETDHRYLEQQWQELLATAKREGQAIGIGHPYPETLAFLKEAVPLLADQGIELVFASELTEKHEEALRRRVLEVSE